jgi:hypothetical protein
MYAYLPLYQFQSASFRQVIEPSYSFNETLKSWLYQYMHAVQVQPSLHQLFFDILVAQSFSSKTTATVAADSSTEIEIVYGNVRLFCNDDAGDDDDDDDDDDNNNNNNNNNRMMTTIVETTYVCIHFTAINQQVWFTQIPFSSYVHLIHYHHQHIVPTSFFTRSARASDFLRHFGFGTTTITSEFVRCEFTNTRRERVIHSCVRDMQTLTQAVGKYFVERLAAYTIDTVTLCIEQEKKQELEKQQEEDDVVQFRRVFSLNSDLLRNYNNKGEQKEDDVLTEAFAKGKLFYMVWQQKNHTHKGNKTTTLLSFYKGDSSKHILRTKSFIWVLHYLRSRAPNMFSS